MVLLAGYQLQTSTQHYLKELEWLIHIADKERIRITALK